jgi:hypothetical protein
LVEMGGCYTSDTLLLVEMEAGAGLRDGRVCPPTCGCMVDMEAGAESRC